jgi:hypothetical protein
MRLYKGLSRDEIMEIEGWTTWDVLDWELAEAQIDDEESLEDFLDTLDLQDGGID